jgi:hypothetical protein
VLALHSDTVARVAPLLGSLVVLCLAAGCSYGRFAWQAENIERAGEREFGEMMVRKGYRYRPELLE